MNVLSLFSGIGGLDLGLEQAGMTVVGQVEIDPWCRSILAKHWPEVPRHDDVRTTAEWWGGRAVDLVCGGFPCQPVSVAGKRQAQKDSRWLWPAFAGVIRDLGPRFVLVENVPGLLGRGLGDVLGDLAGIGYDAEWDCVPAVFVGAPHIRNRVWIVAYPEGQCGELRAPTGQRPGRPAGSRADVADPVSSGLRQQPVTEPRSGHQALAPVNGQDRDVADTSSTRPQGRRDIQAGRSGPAASRLPVADTASQRRTRTVFPRQDMVNDRPEPAHSDAGTRRDSDWWAAEPDVGRVAHGIPRRVDRLRGLGNAVVPQVAEHVGRLIMAAASP